MGQWCSRRSKQEETEETKLFDFENLQNHFDDKYEETQEFYNKKATESLNRIKTAEEDLSREISNKYNRVTKLLDNIIEKQQELTREISGLEVGISDTAEKLRSEINKDTEKCVSAQIKQLQAVIFNKLTELDNKWSENSSEEDDNTKPTAFRDGNHGKADADESLSEEEEKSGQLYLRECDICKSYTYVYFPRWGLAESAETQLAYLETEIEDILAKAKGFRTENKTRISSKRLVFKVIPKNTAKVVTATLSTVKLGARITSEDKDLIRYIGKCYGV
jgi:hypothetical protein